MSNASIEFPEHENSGRVPPSGTEGSAPGAASAEQPAIAGAGTLKLGQLAAAVAIGDLVFIRVSARPFREVSVATGSWTNHVGVVVNAGPDGVVVAESTFPFARKTSLARFTGRSERARVAVSRLKVALTPAQVECLHRAVDSRLGTFYDTGFNLRSRRQFCSRFVREVLCEATGLGIGEVETFAHLLQRRPDADLRFWTAWYFGRIPWSRETVTPASLLTSPAVEIVFDGRIAPSNEVTFC